MQGHQDLIAMRRTGKRPERVLLAVQDRPQWLDANRCGQVHHEVTVRPGESIDRMDLRFVIGLDVVVTAELGEGHERTVRALCAACVSAGAERVAGVEEGIGEPMRVLFQHGVPDGSISG